MTIISKDEWKRRYAKVLIEQGGLSQDKANQAAEDAIELADEFLTPEDAAADEMSYWCEAA
jgi:hypothetical protein